jgi:outer membrane receptor protein involved in Fe transport
MIERYRVADKTYTYGNIEKGRIRGLELEWEVFPWSGFSLFGNAAVLDGKSLMTGAALNDIPPQRLHLGGRAWIGRLSQGRGPARKKQTRGRQRSASPLPAGRPRSSLSGRPSGCRPVNIFDEPPGQARPGIGRGTRPQPGPGLSYSF